MEPKGNRRRERYVKAHLGFSYVLTPAQERFLKHMVELHRLKSLEAGFKTDLTRREYMKLMDLREFTFDATARELVDMGLIIRRGKSNRNRVYYDLNTEAYERLVDLASCTSSLERLARFIDFNIKKLGRCIDSITYEEMESLARNP